MSNHELQLLLLDNASMSQVVNEGEFKSTMLTFEEAKAILKCTKKTMLSVVSAATLLKRLFSNILTLTARITHTKNLPISARVRMQ